MLEFTRVEVEEILRHSARKTDSRVDRPGARRQAAVTP
jgi:hypothetical protein